MYLIIDYKNIPFLFLSLKKTILTNRIIYDIIYVTTYKYMQEQ